MIHSSWKKHFKDFLEKYGEQGEDLFYTWAKKKGFDVTKPADPQFTQKQVIKADVTQATPGEMAIAMARAKRRIEQETFAQELVQVVRERSVETGQTHKSRGGGSANYFTHDSSKDISTPAKAKPAEAGENE